jgi:hypothetical protein
VHVPAATAVAVAAVVVGDPDTLHMSGVVESSDTGSSEVAEAARVTRSPTFTSGGWSKVIVCPFFTWNDCASRDGR